MARPRMLRPTLFLLLAGLPLAAQHERREEGPRSERPRGERSRETRAQPGRGREQALPPRAESRPERQGRPEGHGRSEHQGRPGRVERPGPPREAPERREMRHAPGPRSEREVSRPSPRGTEGARAWQSREPWRKEAWPARSTWREHRARHWEREHRTWAQRGGYGGYRIPEPQFVASFGARNPFRLGSRPVIYRGYPRFRCGGFWFLIVDPWPEFWVDDWYLTDAVYIDYHLDGYYLFNPRYPGIRVALTVFL